MKRDISRAIGEIGTFLTPESKKIYEEELVKSVNSRLFDFSILLIWKEFILFIYERFEQIRVLDSRVFQSRTKDKSIQVRKINNLYSYNEYKDEEIINLLKDLYSIDHNFIKKLGTLKSDRNIAAHVSDPELKTKESGVRDFCAKLIDIERKIQKEHQKQYLRFPSNLNIYQKLKLSEEDVKFIIIEIIDFLPVVPDFKTANRALLFLEKYINNIDSSQCVSILDNALKNKNKLNQVLRSSQGPIFFRALLKNIKIEKEPWRKFYIGLLEEYISEENTTYTELRGMLKRSGIDVEKEEENLWWMPEPLDYRGE
jgi:hypothetical protein